MRSGIFETENLKYFVNLNLVLRRLPTELQQKFKNFIANKTNPFSGYLGNSSSAV